MDLRQMEKSVIVILLALHYGNARTEIPSIMGSEISNNEFSENEVFRKARQESIALGGCKLVVNDLCPAPDVNFFLYTKKYITVPEAVRIGSDPHVSNLSSTAFNPKNPTKIIVHGYNSDMHLSALVEIKNQYLFTYDYNVFAVDYASLAQGPCYLTALWNIRHVGKCASQLVERIKEFGTEDIHILGFSLGAHVANYIAQNLKPYKVKRITGLDPAMPGFLTATKDHKLDKSDGEFVDVLHTNSFMQGIPEESGHLDFYLNGGVIQPGCWAERRFFACNHHRAPLYFAESINTKVGFFGWPCASYTNYFIGNCPIKDPQIIMGEHVNITNTGVHLVITESVSPYAIGKYTGPTIEIIKLDQKRSTVLSDYAKTMDTYLDDENMSHTLYHQHRVKKYLNDILTEDLDP